MLLRICCVNAGSLSAANGYVNMYLAAFMSP